MSKGAKVLDIGGCESLLPLFLAEQGFKVTVYDFRKYPEHHANLTNIKGDFLENKLPKDSFDYVVLISTIEHMGFGSYGAPIYKNADFRAMSEIKRILKPNGKIIITFPFVGKHKIIAGFERWYDLNRTKKLFANLHILAEEYYVPNHKLFGRWLNFAPSSLKEIQQVENNFKHQGCACFVASPNSRSHFQ
ncbi:MAG: class I SAM-dependent methyltransferase [Patescibacteria group bacterium]|nr:class I SAM-dependent methyltransferase [Patescibacteria group bacterium]